MKIIMGDNYTSYEGSCSFIKVAKISSRGSDLCTNYTIKLFKSKRSKEFFTPYSVNGRTKHNKLVKENTCRTTRCFNAPLNYLARLVNMNKNKIESSLKWKNNKLCFMHLKNPNCFLWIIGALSSHLFCIKLFLIHKIFVHCSLPLVLLNKPLSK